MAAAQPNNRASLLAGLRTGGVRSVSVPQTAAPAGSFNVPRIPPSSSFNQAHTFFSEQEEVDGLADMVSQTVHIRDPRDLAAYRQSRTASLDTSGSRLSQQQHDLLMQRQYNAQLAATPDVAQNTMTSPEVQNQAHLQLQMMQMEIMRLQAMAQMQQIAQFQAESVQAQRQQNWRGHGMPEPATAGARTQSFAAAGCVSPLAQLRARQMEQVYTQQSDEQSVPMTAALGGRFGSRPHQDNAHNSMTSYSQNSGSTRSGTMSTPLSATLPNSASLGGGVSLSQSKSDSAVSWRRSSVSMLSKGREVSRSSSSAEVSPPSSDSERASPPLPHSGAKNRPEPLRFSTAISAVNAQAVTSLDGSDVDDSSSSKSADDGSSSSPTTPLSGSSHMSSSSAREEASKKLFQGLGLGRPSIHVTAPGEVPLNIPQRIVSQPIRQPRGPPGASDELGGKNFANRIRKRAIGGLGALLEARERRDILVEGEVY